MPPYYVAPAWVRGVGLGCVWGVWWRCWGVVGAPLAEPQGYRSVALRGSVGVCGGVVGVVAGLWGGRLGSGWVRLGFLELEYPD